MTHITSRIPSPRSGAGQALYRGRAGRGRRQAGRGQAGRGPGGFLRAAVDGMHRAGGSSFLGSGKKKDGGGFLHQSRNPRCSEPRKSFRISQRTAPIPRLFVCQGLRSCPSKTHRPSHRRPEGPVLPRPVRRLWYKARSADTAHRPIRQPRICVSTPYTSICVNAGNGDGSSAFMSLPKLSQVIPCRFIGITCGSTLFSKLTVSSVPSENVNVTLSHQLS